VPGVALAISGVGFAAVTTFVALLFAQRGWTPIWLAFSALSLAFMAGRLLFGHLPDRIVGAKVAFVCTENQHVFVHESPRQIRLQQGFLLRANFFWRFIRWR
jgi:MFS family permease